MSKGPPKDALRTEAELREDIGFHLLQMQQRLEAWDRLYNEEMSQLQLELAQVKRDFVQRYAAARQQAKARRPRRRPQEPPQRP